MTTIGQRRALPRRAWLRAACAAAATTALHARAESWPSRPIKIIVPWPAGGAGDTYARSVAGPLAASLGQPVVIDNRPGATGTIGVAMAAKAAPDGYTLVLGSINDLAAAPAMKVDLTYSPVRDFVPIAQIAAAPLVLCANPSLGVSTFRELVTFARARSEPLTYGLGGVGTTGHVAAAVLASKAGLRLLHVPYKGQAPNLAALVGGEVEVGSHYLAAALPLIEARRIRPLLVFGPRRLPVLAGVPTAAEAGVRGLEFVGWTGLLAPAHTPPDIIERLNREVVKALARPEIAREHAKFGTLIGPHAPEAFGALIQSELGRWREMVEATGIRTE